MRLLTAILLGLAAALALLAPADAMTFKKIHLFKGPDGLQMRAPLVRGKDGVFYGLTVYRANGGCDPRTGQYESCGTAFKLVPKLLKNGNTSYTLTTLHQFSNPVDGSWPWALVVGGDGMLYGTTSLGGSTTCLEGCGTLFQIDPVTGKFTLLHSFTAQEGAGGRPLVVGRDGMIYGLTAEGGSADCGGFGCGTIFKLDPVSKAVTFVHVFTQAEGFSPDSLTQGPDGKLYGTAVWGGRAVPCTQTQAARPGCGTIFRFDPVTGDFARLFAFAGGLDGAAPFVASAPDSLVAGADGVLYGLAGGGLPNGCFDGGCGMVFKFDPVSQKFDPLKLFNWSPTNPDGNQPTTLIMGGDGFLYGATGYGGPKKGCKPNGCGLVFRIDPATAAFETLYSFVGREKPWTGGLMLDPAGVLYGATGAAGNMTTCGGFGCGMIFKLTP